MCVPRACGRKRGTKHLCGSYSLPRPLSVDVEQLLQNPSIEAEDEASLRHRG